MENQNKTGYQSHLFICTNGPDKEGKCGSKNSEQLRKSLKEKCSQAFGRNVRINASGCLGYCEQGIAAVLYSENAKAAWKLNLTDQNGEELFSLVNQSLKK